ncbi:DUF3307 domain-containing protein [Pontibacter liquoris]|uniref:DUF3307 domain-containing protein n=1 Tax=Pontibacter liquoris TaxID=2905677 RepID=UPI001FA75DE4|nr:DUF3307 domain-containing protein [Pontibacter liquoris]
MILFFKLLLAHFIGDFCVQPDAWVKDKETRKLRSPKLYLHMAVHATALLLLLGFNTRYWLGFVVILVSHFLIDVAKLYLQNDHNKRLLFFLDQLAHLVVLAAVVYSYTPYTLHFSSLYTPENLLLAIFLVFVTYVSAVLIKVLISRWSPNTESTNGESLGQAGRFIGILERVLVFVFIITNHWEAVGFLLAAKSVFRFGDLKESKDRKLTEYVLIGTLLSFGIAIAAGLAFLYLVQSV